ncbi:MAG: alkaline phosphatase D family protein [Gemmataceae bacterium]
MRLSLTVAVISVLVVSLISKDASQHAIAQEVTQNNTNAFRSQWHGSRIWIGPEFWANPLQDWQVENAEVVGLAGKNRTLHLLTHQVGKGNKGFTMQVSLHKKGQTQKSQRVWGGFAFGIQGSLKDYRHVLIHPKKSIYAGVRSDGKVFVGKSVSKTKVPTSGPIQLTLKVQPSGTMAQAEFIAKAGGKTANVRVEISPEAIPGNVALVSAGPAKRPKRDDGVRWHFTNWNVSGPQVVHRPNQTFGPILWTQYTLSGGVLKLTAQMPPLGKSDDQQVRLEVRREGKWTVVKRAKIDSLSRTATFRVPNWDSRHDVPYRTVYNWQGEDHFWSGTIRRDPKDKKRVTVAVMSCDNGYVFPHTRLTRNLTIQNPDLLCYLGDQIYESFGGFGTVRGPTKLAMLDYLRKWYQFGWSHRELLKDRPAVIIPDDHDVFQGNLWGQGGRPLPGTGKGGKRFALGGYIMPPDWVNAVSRTQTSHLPDSVDPTPCQQGITVYFTRLLYAGLDIAILEDRKFKSGAASLLPKNVRKKKDPNAYDVKGAQFLGKRQEEFLATWVKRPDAGPKVVMSQTIFCMAHTHAGGQLKRHYFDVDSGGWPRSGRERALRPLMGKGVVMLHGDQHLGVLLQHGVDDWEDGPVAFMVPGTANGFPRAWWPEKPGKNRKPGSAEWTGRFLDDFGNRMTILAAGNPEKGSNRLPRTNPEMLAHRKGSGHGLVHFEKDSGRVTFELWRLMFDATRPRAKDQFTGFPVTKYLNPAK